MCSLREREMVGGHANPANPHIPGDLASWLQGQGPPAPAQEEATPRRLEPGAGEPVEEDTGIPSSTYATPHLVPSRNEIMLESDTFIQSPLTSTQRWNVAYTPTPSATKSGRSIKSALRSASSFGSAGKNVRIASLALPAPCKAVSGAEGGSEGNKEN